ncbi:V5 protein [Persimmon circular DNA virus]|nr:V5 protein [Persimmon circular DNA virus]
MPSSYLRWQAQRCRGRTSCPRMSCFGRLAGKFPSQCSCHPWLCKTGPQSMTWSAARWDERVPTCLER